MSDNENKEKTKDRFSLNKGEYSFSFTKEQLDTEMENLREVYPVVRLIDGQKLQNGSCLLFDDDAICGRKVCAKLLQEGGEREWTFYIGTEGRKVSARYVNVEGEDRVLMCISPTQSGQDPFDKRLLYIDSLTGAYNRRFYEDELRKQRLFAGVAIIDLDDFKTVNDTLGHHTGDIALRMVAETILRSMRSTDMLVRIGGDEFVLIMPNVDSEAFSRRLETISRSVSQSSVPGYDEVNLTVSIGGIISKGNTIEEALRQADDLMYRAKNNYRVSVVTDADAVDANKFHKPLLLIVDDSQINRTILSEMLKDEYEIIEVDRGNKAIEVLREYGNEITVVLLDIIMPGMSGFDVLSVMSHNGWIEDIPVVMISSEDSDDVIFRAYEQGASDYVSRPFDMRVVRQRVNNVMRLYARQRRLSALLAQQYYEREKSSNTLVNIMGGAMELRNGESGPHVLHVRNLTEILLDCLLKKTDRYVISGRKRSAIILSSVMHDIGKLAIPDVILNKPGKLTDEEFEIMKSHTVKGSEMLNNLNMYSDNPLLIETAHDICRWHHERYDGNGYPDHLQGDKIPISAQIVSLADVYDALTSERVYKDAYSHEEAMQMILNNECGVFNPLLIECLVEMESRILEELNIPSLTPPLSASQNKGEVSNDE